MNAVDKDRRLGYSQDGTTQTLYKEVMEKKKTLARWNGVTELEQKENTTKSMNCEKDRQSWIRVQT